MHASPRPEFCSDTDLHTTLWIAGRLSLECNACLNHERSRAVSSASDPKRTFDIASFDDGRIEADTEFDAPISEGRQCLGGNLQPFIAFTHEPAAE